MYSKACPICGDVVMDNDMDKLIERMKTHLAAHDDEPADKQLADSVIPPAAASMEDGKRMKTSTANASAEPHTDVLVRDETAFVPDGFMSPAASIKDALAAFKMFDVAKAELLRDSDVLWFGKSGAPVAKGAGGAKPYLLKSAWRRMARFFGLSIDIEGRDKLESGDHYMWTYRYRITHPCGAYVVSEGVCSSLDQFFTSGGRKKADEADIMLKAQTVAINRGISDLLGSGEVSADEMLKG